MESYSDAMPPSPNTEVIQRCTCLTRIQQLALIQEVTTKEIDRTIKYMPLEKKLGVDGFPVKFGYLKKIYMLLYKISLSLV